MLREDSTPSVRRACTVCLRIASAVCMEPVPSAITRFAMSIPNDRRGFLHRLLAAGSLAAVAAPSRLDAQPAGEYAFLPPYARAQTHKSLKQSSYDTTGGNSDRWPIAPGASHDVFKAD